MGLYLGSGLQWGFLTLELVIFWVRSFFVKGLFCVWLKCLAASLASIHLMTIAVPNPHIVRTKNVSRYHHMPLSGLPLLRTTELGNFDSPRQLSLVHHKSSKRNRLSGYFLLSSCSKDKWKILSDDVSLTASLFLHLSPCNNTNVHYYLRHQLIKEISPSKCFTLN